MAAFILLLGGGLYLLWPRPPVQEELHVNGRPLTFWLREAAAERTPRSRAAIQQAGTNALPELLGQLQPREKTKSEQLEMDLRTKAWSILRVDLSGILQAGSEEEWQGALEAFRILGTNAAPVIPELVAMLKSESSFVGRAEPASLLIAGNPIGVRAAVALAGLGDPGFFALLEALASTNSLERTHAASGLARVPPTRERLQELLQALAQPEQYHSPDVLRILGAYTDYPKEIVPVLIEFLYDPTLRPTAATLLARFGADAAPALPVLEALLPADTFARIPAYLFNAVDEIKAAVQEEAGAQSSR